MGLVLHTVVVDDKIWIKNLELNLELPTRKLVSLQGHQDLEISSGKRM